MHILFSKRYEIPLKENKLILKNINELTRNKVIYLMKDLDTLLYSFINEMKEIFLKSTGYAELRIYESVNKYKIAQDITEYMKKCSVKHFLDLIEIFYTVLTEEYKKKNFLDKINLIFEVDRLPYRLLDGEIIIIDSAFLEAQILNKIYKLFRDKNFKTALSYLQEAKQHYTAGNYNSVIQESYKMIEATVEKIINKDNLNQKELKKEIKKLPFIPNYFNKFIDTYIDFIESVFIIANNSGGRHGKKEMPEEINKIDKYIASFTLNISASLMLFLIERYIKFKKEGELKEETEEPLIDDDEIPF